MNKTTTRAGWGSEVRGQAHCQGSGSLNLSLMTLRSEGSLSDPLPVGPSDLSFPSDALPSVFDAISVRSSEDGEATGQVRFREQVHFTKLHH